MTSRLSLPAFDALDVAVAGDLICDHYVACEPRGLSREAPVMVLRHVEETFGAGGAANVARNLAALGARTRCVGTVGRDARGRDVIERLEREGIDVAGVESLPEWITPTKMRVIAAEQRRFPQQVLRIDREPDRPLPQGAGQKMAERVRAMRGRVAALVVSDYGYGAVGSHLAGAAVELAVTGTVVVLDPRRRVQGFEGVTAITPNVGELAVLSGVEPEVLAERDALAGVARALLERTRVRFLLVTRGNLGMALWGAGLPRSGRFVGASGAGEVTDVSGAGDTAAAVFALALAAGEDAPRAMELANAAAGVVVMEAGTATCDAAELRAALPLEGPAPARGARRSAPR